MSSTSPLAIHGGPAVIPAGPPPWPLPDDAVRDALLAAYADGNWGRYHGPYCQRLAQALAEYHAVEHVTLCCSGTVAVELALRGLGVGPGDEVILAGYDFPGNFRAVEACGAMPVLVDIAARNWNLDPALLPQAASARTKAVLVSHLHGGSVPMAEVMAVARERGWQVLEDACQSPGATVQGRLAGTWGDASVWSFGGSKLLTAGRGGALFSRSAEVHQRAKIFSDRGNQAFPLSELQAAVLLPQLARLDEHNAARRAAAERLTARIGGHCGLRPLANETDGTLPGYYKLGFEYTAVEAGGMTREDFVAAARAEGVAIDAGFRGFARRGGRCRKAGSLENSVRAAADALVLHHPVLLSAPEIIDRVAEALDKVAAHGALGAQATGGAPATGDREGRA